MRENNPSFTKDNFDYMVDLYRTNPKEFERIKRLEIERLIKNAHPKSHAILRGVQFKIDVTLARYKNPIVRMNKMVAIFWDGVKVFENTLKGDFVIDKNKILAEVIPLFPNRKK